MLSTPSSTRHRSETVTPHPNPSSTPTPSSAILPSRLFHNIHLRHTPCQTSPTWVHPTPAESITLPTSSVPLPQHLCCPLSRPPSPPSSSAARASVAFTGSVDPAALHRLPTYFPPRSALRPPPSIAMPAPSFNPPPASPTWFARLHATFPLPVLSREPPAPQPPTGAPPLLPSPPFATSTSTVTPDHTHDGRPTSVLARPSPTPAFAHLSNHVFHRNRTSAPPIPDSPPPLQSTPYRPASPCGNPSSETKKPAASRRTDNFLLVRGTLLH